MTQDQGKRKGHANEIRSILFLDLDCFEVQIWMNKLRPDLIGKDVPIVVINHANRILSVNYTAKSFGVKRGDRESLEQAHLYCKENGMKLIEIKAPERFGKADNFYPQIQSDGIAKILQDFQAFLEEQSFPTILERASKDEFYMDLTDVVRHRGSTGYIWTWFNNQIQSIGAESCLFNNIAFFDHLNTWQLAEAVKFHPNRNYNGKPVTVLETEHETVSGRELVSRMELLTESDTSEISLLRAAIIAQSLIELINVQTPYKFQTSAGVGHSKLMAKIACDRNKPQGITVMTATSPLRLSEEIPFTDIPGLGGSTGLQLKEYFEIKFTKKIITVSDLLRASNQGSDFESILKELNLENAVKISKEFRNFCHFVDERPVVPIVHKDRFSTLLSFNRYDTRGEEFKNRIRFLSRDMEERIKYNCNEGRRPQNLHVKVKRFVENDNLNGENTMKLECNSSYQNIYRHVLKYCEENHIYNREISNICLTAKNIIEI